MRYVLLFYVAFSLATNAVQGAGQTGLTARKNILATGGVLATNNGVLAGRETFFDTSAIDVVGGNDYTVRMESMDFTPHVWVQPVGAVSPERKIAEAVGAWLPAPVSPVPTRAAEFSFRAPATGRLQIVVTTTEPRRPGYYSLMVWMR